MDISEFVWNDDIIEHIARHDVTAAEVEETCFGKPLIIKSKQPPKGTNPIYYALGLTESGRYLFVMFIYFKRGRAMVVTARDMDYGEKNIIGGTIIMSKDSKIPDFNTIQEAREFWKKHSLADFANELEEAKEVKFTRKGNLVVSLKLEKEDEKRLRQLAEKKGVKYSDLITSWVKEHLSEN